MSYDRMGEAVKAAWDATGADTLEELIAIMPQKCQAVIDANGIHRLLNTHRYNTISVHRPLCGAPR